MGFSLITTLECKLLVRVRIHGTDSTLSVILTAAQSCGYPRERNIMKSCGVRGLPGFCSDWPNQTVDVPLDDS